MMATLCRACLTDVDLKEKQSFYEIIQEEDPISVNRINIFTILTSIELDTANDAEFPQQLCGSCADQFEMIKEFRKNCILSNQWLMRQVELQQITNSKGESGEHYNNDWNEHILTTSTENNYVAKIEITNLNFIKAGEIEIANDIFEADTESPNQNAIIAHYECDKCSKIFNKRHQITAHLRQHCGLKPYACPMCNKSFARWSSHQLHQQKYHADNKQLEVFRCNFDGCTKFYDLRQTLKVHEERVHLGVKPKLSTKNCVCETCGKSFKSKYFLNAHNFTHQSSEYWPFPCELCPKRFISKYKFKVHMMRHNNIKNFACHLCDRRTCTKKELDTHIGYHNKEYSFPCDQCESMFRSKVALQRHTRVVHRGYKPYTCTFCNLTFAKHDTLKHHTMRHTGEKPHACSLCDRRFIQVVALRAHMKTHQKQ